MNKKNLFNKFSQSPVYLEEHNHVYVHKETGVLYNSVTTALSLLKEDFDKDNIIDAIIKQYNNFISWYRKNNGNEEHLGELLFDYIMYGKKRPFQIFNGKKIFKALSKYETIIDLSAELWKIKKENPNPTLKGFYLKPDNTVMSKEEILKVWEITNLLSRHYGHMIHESLELYFLEIQGFPVDRVKKLKNIQEKHRDLNALLLNVDRHYNNGFFSVYDLDLNALDFMEWIIHKFKQINPYKGTVIIPEKVNFSPTFEICGTTDVEVVFDDIDFEIEDHKTNKEFTFVNEYDKFLKSPVDDMPETSFSTYSLQLNIYGYIQEIEFGRRFKGARVTYFDRKKKEFDLIELPILLDKAEIVLRNFKQFQDEWKEKFRLSGILDNSPSNYHNVLTKRLFDDIEKRKKNGTIDLNAKQENKLYYKEFVQKNCKILTEHI